MILCDVNVLVVAHREEMVDHEAVREWLDRARGGPEPFAVSDHVLAGFVRVVTHPRVFDPPTPAALAIEFADRLHSDPHAVPVAPGPRHWSIFKDLCRTADARGNLVADAYLAALAIECGCEWVSLDRDFARFADLRWRQPLSR